MSSYVTFLFLIGHFTWNNLINTTSKYEYFTYFKYFHLIKRNNSYKRKQIDLLSKFSG